MPFTTFPIPSVELQSIAGDARSAINALENSNAAVNTAIALNTSATTTAIGASTGGSGVGDANKIAKFQADGGLAVGQSINLATENATVVDNDFIGVSAVSTPNATRKSKLSTVWNYIKSKIESAASFSLTGQWAFSSSAAGNTVTITQTGTGNALEVIGNATDDSLPEIKISGSGGFIDIHNELSFGAWNPLAQSGDKGIIFSAGGAGTGDLDPSEAFVTYKAQFSDTYGDNPTTEVQAVPAEWYQYLAHGTYADYLRAEGQQEKAALADQEAEGLLQDELIRIDEQHTLQMVANRIFTNANMQSRY